MPINPFAHPTNFAVPTFDMGNARAPESTWSNIASLGESIGKVRERDTMAELLKSATDKNGNLDLNKAATAIALSGRDPTQYLTALTAQERERSAAASARALADYHLQSLKLQRDVAEQGKTSEFEVEDPLGLKPKTRYRRHPNGTLEQIYPPPPTPDKTSALEPDVGTPSQALAFNATPPAPPIGPGNIPLAPRLPQNPLSPQPPIGPGGPPGQRIGEQMPLPFDPETAPPYQVAGPPMPPPRPSGAPAVAQAPAPVVAPAPAPAVTPAPAADAKAAARATALEKFGQTYGPDAQNVFRDILDYKRGLPHDDKLRQRYITAARAIDDTFDPHKYDEMVKEGPQNNPYAAPGKAATESQSKDATYAQRLFGAENILRRPDIEKVATEMGQHARSMVPLAGNYMVRPEFQEYDQAARDFINAILRRESGASISSSEFANAYTQYLPRPGDERNPAVMAQKQANREAAIKGIASGAGSSFIPSHIFDEKGDLVPNAKAPATIVRPVTNDAEANQARKDAVDALSKLDAMKLAPGVRAQALRDIHERLRQKHVPPALWPR